MKKILVIEDSAPFRNLFLKYLRAKGFDAIAASNGFEGIKQAKEQLPDLVICDILMPELDGYSVLATLRQNPETATIPIIVVTAKGERSDLRKAMVLGADDYITKPFTEDELIEAVAASLQKRVALQAAIATRMEKQAAENLPKDTSNLVTPQSIFPDCPQLREVFRFIEANYHRQITLCDVAEAVGYSPSYLTNLVKQQSGHSLYRWIVERRMVEALSLLEKSDMAVNQIAAAVGYKDACHFSRHFRQIHGTSPQAWRNDKRANSAQTKTKELTSLSKDCSLPTQLSC